MPTINTEVEFDVYCTVCSKNLDVDVRYAKGGHQVFVEPCDNCMSDATQEGYTSGIEEGLSH